MDNMSVWRRMVPSVSRSLDPESVFWRITWLDFGIAVNLARDFVWFDTSIDGTRRIQVLSIGLTKTPDPNMLRVIVGPVTVFVTHLGPVSYTHLTLPTNREV